MDVEGECRHTLLAAEVETLFPEKIPFFRAALDVEDVEEEHGLHEEPEVEVAVVGQAPWRPPPTAIGVPEPETENTD